MYHPKTTWTHFRLSNMHMMDGCYWEWNWDGPIPIICTCVHTCNVYHMIREHVESTICPSLSTWAYVFPVDIWVHTLRPNMHVALTLWLCAFLCTSVPAAEMCYSALKYIWKWGFKVVNQKFCICESGNVIHYLLSCPLSSHTNCKFLAISCKRGPWTNIGLIWSKFAFFLQAMIYTPFHKIYLGGKEI